MATYELNEGLAKANIKQGDPGRNPLGIQGSKLVKAKFKEFKDRLYAASNDPCRVHRHDPPVSNIECLVSCLWDLSKSERWACAVILNRMLGRVPLDIELNAKVDWRGELTTEQKERYRQLIILEGQNKLTKPEAIELNQFRNLSGAPMLTPVPSTNVIDVETDR